MPEKGQDVLIHAQLDVLVSEFCQLLSLNFGFIDPARFARQFGVCFTVIFAEAIEFAVAARWLQHSPDGLWRLVPGAFGDLPLLRALFYPPAARAWLESLDPNSSPLTNSSPLSYRLEL